MFTRSTTVSGRPDRIDEGIAYVRDEVMPAVTAMQGCVGMSMMVDRETGQCIVTSSWADEESMRASDLNLAPLRDRGAGLLMGAPEVEEWEVAGMHRDHLTATGAACRVTWMRTNHSDVDRSVAVYRDVILPMMEALPGFCSASLMLNRQLGRACSTTSFDTPEAMEASREAAWAIRDAGVREAGVDVLDVTEFELVLAHLRLPEVA